MSDKPAPRKSDCPGRVRLAVCLRAKAARRVRTSLCCRFAKIQK
jgi:hypothetical protein